MVAQDQQTQPGLSSRRTQRIYALELKQRYPRYSVGLQQTDIPGPTNTKVTNLQEWASPNRARHGFLYARGQTL